MAYLNDNYLKLQAGYLFPEIARRVREFCDANPDAARRVIRCGIGDVTEPLPPAIIAAMHQAVDELSVRETFRGYGHEQGLESLREKIAQQDYRDRGAEVAADEVFVSDGSKPDCGFILDILGNQNRIAITDPVYPVYVDTNVMAGHTGLAGEAGRYEGITYLPCGPDNGFVPEPPREPVDIVYLCFPNNPTGGVASRAQLTRWVEYARAHNTIILFDAAYEAYIRDPEIPHSIYEIPGARECAIEFRSFSKNGGFTGVRCGFTVMPKSLQASTADGRKLPSASAVAPALEHQSKWRELPRATRGRGRLWRRGAQPGEDAGRSLHGKRADPAGSGRACRAARLRRRECSLHLGPDASWPDQLGDVRSNVGEVKCRHHARKRFRIVRRRLLPHLGLQQPRKR